MKQSRAAEIEGRHGRRKGWWVLVRCGWGVYAHARTKGSRASVADGKINISTVPFFHLGSRQNFYIWRGEKKGGGLVFFIWGRRRWWCGG